MKSPLTNELQEESTKFVEQRGYELIDFGIYAKPEWSSKDQFYGIQMGFNLLNGRMGLILVWLNKDDCIKCSTETEVKNFSDFKHIFDHLDVAVKQLDGIGQIVEELA